MDEWIDGWINGWMDGWMDACRGTLAEDGRARVQIVQRGVVDDEGWRWRGQGAARHRIEEDVLIVEVGVAADGG